MILLKIAACRLLILGSGLIFLALVKMDLGPRGSVSRGWRLRHGAVRGRWQA